MHEQMHENTLYKKIIEFITSQKVAPVQKSAEWYKIKKQTIGGSEVATVLGLNPFKTLRALVGEKTGVVSDKFNGNLYTRWGNIFENVTKKWAEEILFMDTEIYESGSLEGVLERQRYSPDGLGVVELNGEYLIVLFEFKAPFKSIPDGKIPKYYRPQIQTGLLSIPIANTSIFINNCYRKCKLKDIGFSYNYNQEFHKDTKIKTKHVFACGVIYFYQTKSQYNKLVKQATHTTDPNTTDPNTTDTNTTDPNTQLDLDDINNFIDCRYSGNIKNVTDDEILIDTADELIDFGDDNNYISRLFELHEEKKVFCKYSPVIINNKDIKHIQFLDKYNKINRVPLNDTPKKIIKEFHNTFMDECDKDELMPIGYLPWKLIKSDIIKDDRIENWYDQIAEPITQTINNIDIISNAENPDQKYYELYPKKKRINELDELQESQNEKIELNINNMLDCILNADIQPLR